MKTQPPLFVSVHFSCDLLFYMQMILISSGSHSLLFCICRLQLETKDLESQPQKAMAVMKR